MRSRAPARRRGRRRARRRASKEANFHTRIRVQVRSLSCLFRPFVPHLGVGGRSRRAALRPLGTPPPSPIASGRTRRKGAERTETHAAERSAFGRARRRTGARAGPWPSSARQARAAQGDQVWASGVAITACTTLRAGVRDSCLESVRPWRGAGAARGEVASSLASSGSWPSFYHHLTALRNLPSFFTAASPCPVFPHPTRSKHARRRPKKSSPSDRRRRGPTFYPPLPPPPPEYIVVGSLEQQ